MARPTSATSERSIAARLTAELGIVVTRKCIQEWTKKGYPLDDTAALKRKLRNQERQRKPEAPAAEPDESLDDEQDEAAPTASLDIDAELKTLQSKLILAGDYEEARTIRTQIAGVKDVLKALREQSYYVTQESQIRRGLAVGQAIKSLVLKIPAELPQMIIGLEYADAVAKCEDYAYSILTELAAAENHGA
jgi:hypothetical protein